MVARTPLQAQQYHLQLGYIAAFLREQLSHMHSATYYMHCSLSFSNLQLLYESTKGIWRRKQHSCLAEYKGMLLCHVQNSLLCLETCVGWHPGAIQIQFCLLQVLHLQLNERDRVTQVSFSMARSVTWVMV